MRDAVAAGIGDAPRPFRPPSDVAAGYDGTFTVHDLSAVRRIAARQGGRAGLGASRLSDFILAVNEVATNAVCHGCSKARLRLWVADENACCEVRGGTSISTAQPSAGPDDSDSLRLWVVWQVCDEVTLSYRPGEAMVAFSMGVP
jgi:serine/threonine-protein kinase RsbW